MGRAGRSMGVVPPGVMGVAAFSAPPLDKPLQPEGVGQRRWWVHRQISTSTSSERCAA